MSERSGPALGRAAATISGLTAAARVTGFIRVLVATAVLGTTFLGNTYQAANGVPNVVFELFAAVRPEIVAAARPSAGPLRSLTRRSPARHPFARHPFDGAGRRRSAPAPVP